MSLTNKPKTFFLIQNLILIGAPLIASIIEKNGDYPRVDLIELYAIYSFGLFALFATAIIGSVVLPLGKIWPVALVISIILTTLWNWSFYRKFTKNDASYSIFINIRWTAWRLFLGLIIMWASKF